MEVAEVEAAIAGTSTVLVMRVVMVVVMFMAEEKAVLATSPINHSNWTLHKEGASAATSFDTGTRSACILQRCEQRHFLYCGVPLALKVVLY